MTIEDIADFCAVRDCSVVLGGPEIGFICVDGNGCQRRSNFARFLSLNELSSLPLPAKVLERATSFTVRLAGGNVLSMDRGDFEAELARLREKVGA